MDSGIDVLVTTWDYEYADLISKCPISCRKVARPTKCENHAGSVGSHVMQIIDAFEERAKYVIENVRHVNLVHYIAVDTEHSCRKLTVNLVQEYIEGISLEELRNQRKYFSIRSMAEETLKAISSLHEMDPVLTHGYLNTKSVFLDGSAVCRVADYDLIPYLMYLKGTHKIHEMSDLNAFGLLIKSQNDLLTQCMDDFVKQCCSGHVLSYSKLFEHSFLSNDWYKSHRLIYVNSLIDHFGLEKKLGSGSFGFVLQAKNHMDKRPYALKFIKIPFKNKKELEQMEREVEIISGINHKHVVRYITSWKQTVNLTDLKNFVDDESFTYSQESTDSGSSMK